MWTKTLLCALPGLLAAPAARAQGEYNNWYFGNRAGLAFSATASAPQPLTNGAMTAPSACATLSDAAGNLLLYTNRDQIWNARHQELPLPNGAIGLGGNTRIAQGCASVHVRTAIYVFTTRFFSSGPVSSPSSYQLEATVIQLDAAGPRVTDVGLRVVADTLLQRLGENDFDPYQTIVRHANGRDFWLILHLFRQDVFLASLIETGGQWPVARTVTSSIRRRIIGPYSYIHSNPVFSPDGRHLLYQDMIFNFDAATGRISNSLQLLFPAPAIASLLVQPYPLGGAFSPNGRYLYLSGSNQSNRYGSTVQVAQFDLSAGTPMAIAASGIEVCNVGDSGLAGVLPGYMQRGPNGLVYLAVQGAMALDVIRAPNARGAACQYTRGYQSLQGRVCGNSLPSQLNDVGLVMLAPGTTGGTGTTNPVPAPLSLTAEALPNVITPNGDPLNEYFALPAAQAAGWGLAVYNRWGRQVFQQTPYDNRWNAAGLPDGTYFYLLQNAASGQRFKGWVEVRR